MNRIVQFLHEAKSELKKVNWPTKKQTTNYTLTVIAISLILSFFLGGLDFIFEYLLKTFILK